MAINQQSTSQLHDKNAAVEFYQERYSRGYMNEWPDETKQRIYEVIRSFEFPEKGEALDFGCGNGVLTDIIRQALPPGWKMSGTDISSIAIENAKTRYPECAFFVAGERQITGKKYDFIFTHHVLEHVFNLSQILDEINDLLKENAAVLHILPCGNAGSFEHKVCLLRSDGIDPNLENRFFFEEKGHIRRLTTERLSKLYQDRGFALVKEYYRCQYYGAIEWITQNGPGFVRMFTNRSTALDNKAKIKLLLLRFGLLSVYNLRHSVVIVESQLHKRGKTTRDQISLILELPFYLIEKPIDSYIKGRILDEWQNRRTERNGSEMYLLFKR